ncbi:hypothetical protein CYG48_04905 [Neorhizobium sp. SOG26]|uniref:hypothetical protein n=1 Tax=Neorhizobium sp. SOG26 TaxID=2060726 RepID=UPI000E596A3A|nr:hypothetical protein [Neorhizobium sp. SOG26]AXV15096.1 hypothetical protein CYG48_04905 [Neorhizobium sp. SOG26]
MTAQAGHNSKLTDQENQALWGHHVSKRVALQRRKDELKAEEDKLKADSKNDGLAEKEIKDFLDCMLSKDKQKKIDQFNMQKRNRIRLGLIPDDRNADLLADRVTSEQMITAAGIEAGLAAIDRASPYAPASSEDRTWLAGYDEGQRIARENLQSAMEKRNAAKSKEEAPSDGDPFADTGDDAE